MNLQELFDECVKDNNGDRIKGTQQFIVRAKKVKPEVKMSECIKIAGFDNKKDEAAFRNNVVIPTRNRIGLVKFQLNAEEIKSLFGRTELTDEQKEQKKQILSLLPARSRVTSTKAMDHIDNFIE